MKRLIVDIPWWPDIDSPIEEVLSSFLPFLKRSLSASKRLDRFSWAPEELPYFDQGKLSDIPELSRAWIIEDGPFGPLKVFFAHHCGVLGEKLS